MIEKSSVLSLSNIRTGKKQKSDVYSINNRTEFENKKKRFTSRFILKTFQNTCELLLKSLLWNLQENRHISLKPLKRKTTTKQAKT